MNCVGTMGTRQTNRSKKRSSKNPKKPVYYTGEHLAQFDLNPGENIASPAGIEGFVLGVRYDGEEMMDDESANDSTTPSPQQQRAGSTVNEHPETTTAEEEQRHHESKREADSATPSDAQHQAYAPLSQDKSGALASQQRPASAPSASPDKTGSKRKPRVWVDFHGKPKPLDPAATANVRRESDAHRVKREVESLRQKLREEELRRNAILRENERRRQQQALEGEKKNSAGKGARNMANGARRPKSAI